MSFIADHQTASVLVGCIGLAGSLGYIAWRANRAADAHAPTVPSATPRPASFELGQAEHQRASQAQTVKLAQAKPTAKDIPTEVMREARSADQKSKVLRMEELGFHAGIDKTPPPRPAIVVPTAQTSAAEATITTDLSGAGVPDEANKQGQAAELDDILSRIDKVLAENPVMATNTMTGATDTNAGTQHETTELTRKPDAGGQQKLF